MKIVILGATGTTGQFAVDEALAAGHEVVAYVRNAPAARERVTVVTGSVEDRAAMATAFSGADAVISCLGARVTPSVLLNGTDFQRRALPTIVDALNDASVKRFVLMSSFGVGETATRASFIPRVFFYSGIAKRLFDDKAVAERALQRCGANWSAVYPVGLKSGRADDAYELVPLDSVKEVPAIPMLSFATVARVLVKLAADDRGAQRLLLTTRGGWR